MQRGILRILFPTVTRKGEYHKFRKIKERSYRGKAERRTMAGTGKGY